ncbi:SOS response-associated peptidase family protein, partial [Streptomyces mirabilis]|uniref:SOS response-associated peptidase family protein n=1 Tax=Streptomyces mirabilis TaxID=68239 RepID=UPI00367701AB
TPDHYDSWLDPHHQDPDELRALLTQPADGHLDARPVSTAVNNVRSNGPQHPRHTEHPGSSPETR